MRPGPDGPVNLLVHKACFDLGITHIESLCNLETLLGAGQFTFIGLPMKWRDGTGSPIRAWAGFGMCFLSPSPRRRGPITPVVCYEARSFNKSTGTIRDIESTAYGSPP